jgi:hypothetical protein
MRTGGRQRMLVRQWKSQEPVRYWRGVQVGGRRRDRVFRYEECQVAGRDDRCEGGKREARGEEEEMGAAGERVRREGRDRKEENDDGGRFSACVNRCAAAWFGSSSPRLSRSATLAL